MKKLFIVFISVLIFLIVNKSVFAVTTTIDNFSSIISTDPFTVNITISSASAGINYLRIDLYKVSATNYFGETFNGSAWSNSGDYTQYYPVTIQSGNNWTGPVQGRLGNPTQTQFDGFGQYKMRVRRYTSSGSYNTTEANNSAIDVVINIPILTPTLILIPTSTIIPTLGSEGPTPTFGTDDPYPTLRLEDPTPTINSYNNIYLSEAMVNPINGEKEWVEIYNDNDFPVNLTDWNIDDLENGGSSPKVFSLAIEKKSSAAFDISSSIFNNSGDSVRLLDFNKSLKDSFEYLNSQPGKTFGRTAIDSDDFCLQEPSKNYANNSCLNPTPTTTPILRSEDPTPTYNIIQTKIPTNMGLINQTPTSGMGRSRPTPAYTLQTTSYNLTPEVLGLSAKNNKKYFNLINLLSILSFSYSLLTIISILFKMKLGYGKNKKLYSLSFYSPRRE